jgi:enoyl-CoA hydratase/carnithine racemase
MIKVNRIAVRKEGSVLTIKLNEPEKLNVLDVEIRKNIMNTLKDYQESDVKCVVFRAEGKVFSAGADLKYILKLSKKEALEYASFVKEFLSYVENYPKPTIGVVEGIAVGGGLELLQVLDMVIATEDAKFGQTELRVGLIPGGGGTQRLPRIIGQRMAKEMVFTSRLISAEEALIRGLVNRVVKRDGLEEELKKITESISEKDSDLLSLSKMLINHSLKRDMEKGLKLESKTYASILPKEKTKKAIREFLA